MISRSSIPPKSWAETTMNPEAFRLIRGLLRDHAGLLFSEETAFLLERRMAPRLAILHQPTSLAYAQHLLTMAPAARDAELTALFERIATHETYFFREAYQLDAFRLELLPELHKRKRRGTHLSFWSAGCSTGEEAYTIAMEVMTSGLFKDWDVQILGTDLSGEALTVAEAGIYGPSALRQTSEEHLARFFRPHKGRFQVIDEIRRMVRFAPQNLNRPFPPSEPFDAIFCRNVLIYFDRALRPQLVHRFAEHLLPGGYLLLGHAESLLDESSPFETCHLHRAMVYRKPGM
jgi:chemotaxis protein methyltransferase CheR